MPLNRWYKHRAKQLLSMRALLLRPIIFVVLSMGCLVGAELIALARLTWLNHQRIQTIEADVGKGHQLEDTLFELLQLQANLSQQQQPASHEQVTELEKQLIELLRTQNNSDLATQADLKMLQDTFSKAIEGDQQSLIDSLQRVRQVLNKQTEEEEKLLISVEHDSQLELQLALILPILLFAIGYYFLRNNVLEPLESLKELLSGLANGVKQPITRPTTDPTLGDLFARYNRLVAHLVELEQEHANYTSALESQVKETSQALLEQSRRLSKTERLAALTEMAASTAHELRNPLTIIQISLENLLNEATDPDTNARIQLLHREVQRLTNHLNDLLSSARSGAEIAQAIDIKQVLKELTTLLNYQIHDNIQLSYQAPEALVAYLPETEFRQVLVNLVQNAIQAIGSQLGSVTIDAQRQDQNLQIRVVDSGGGFSEAFLRQGVRPFVSLKQKGTGLGLVMVQRFVREHHGHLKLENTGNGQAQVILTLPLQSPLN